MTAPGEAARRRARNMVWAAAGEYGYEPPFLALRPDGGPDPYLNLIFGLARKWLDEEALRAFFASYAASPRCQLFDELVWLGLENCLYEKELPWRPALAELRRAHAESFFSQEETLTREQRLSRLGLGRTLRAARWSALLGRRGPLLTPRERRLLQALALPGTLNTAQATAALGETLRRELHFFGCGPLRPPRRISVRGIWARALLRLVPAEAVRTESLSAPPSRQTESKAAAQAAAGRTAAPEEEQGDRAYLTACFGPSLFPEGERLALERALCTGAHRGCHLWLSRGRGAGGSGEGGRRALEAAEQYQRNLAYYQEQESLCRSGILRLSEQLAQALRSHSQLLPVPARAGRLDSRRVWRLGAVHEAAVFTRPAEDPHPDFTVDLLLDASSSRTDSQQSIAAQAFIIAKSLGNCGIPAQVSSFRSLRGYTVLQVYQRRGESAGREIFRYFAAGWNRDGLALRAAGELLGSGGEKHILLVLTDANPNDDRRTAASPLAAAGRDYSGHAGVADAAAEVSALRRSGVRVAAVFLGPDGTVSALRTIYGGSFARIRRIDQLAGAVGELLCSEIRALE